MKHLIFTCILFLGISATSSAQVQYDVYSGKHIQTVINKVNNEGKIIELTITCRNSPNEVCFIIIYPPKNSITEKMRVTNPEGFDYEGTIEDISVRNSGDNSLHTLTFKEEEE